MYKTQFFQSSNIDSLQDNVNEWLSKQQDIFIVNSNITSLNSKIGDQYVFYIFYEDAKTAIEEAHEIIADQETNVNPLTNIEDVNLQ